VPPISKTPFSYTPHAICSPPLPRDQAAIPAGRTLGNQSHSGSMPRYCMPNTIGPLLLSCYFRSHLQSSDTTAMAMALTSLTFHSCTLVIASSQKSKPTRKKPTYNSCSYQTITRIQQCKVEIDRTIFYCGMHSHISAGCRVYGYIYDCRVYLQILSNPACQRLHETGTLSLGGSAIISGAAPNSTITSSINLTGSTTVDGRCSGT